VDRYSFPVRIFHSLLHAGLPRRTNIPICTHCGPRGWTATVAAQKRKRPRLWLESWDASLNSASPEYCSISSLRSDSPVGNGTDRPKRGTFVRRGSSCCKIPISLNEGSELSRGRQHNRVLRRPADAAAIRADYCTPLRDPSLTSVKNYDPTVRPLDLSNTTSGPLSRCGLCLRLISEWGASDESKQAKSNG
jgi:hypothetical protein